MSDAEKPKWNEKNPAIRLSNVDLDNIEHRFLVVLKREAYRLMEESYVGKISDESAKNLINYLKLLKDFKKHQENELEKLTDAELEALTGITTEKEDHDGE